MAFERLTNELLIEIVKYATLDGSVSTLRNLASVNQILNCIATPILYSKFDEVSCTSVPKLLRAILENPELATYVRSYTGHGIWNRSLKEKLELVAMLRQGGKMLEAGRLSQEEEALDVSEWDDDDFAACRETLRMIELDIELDSEMVEDWMSRIGEGKWHAMTGLLLLLLPNLEDIEMIDYRFDQEGDMEFALGIPAVLQESETSSQFALGHLTDVSLSAYMPHDNDDPYGSREESEYLNFDDVMPFLTLPSVESVAISGLSNEMGQFGSSMPQDTNFGIKDLEINNTCLDMWYLIRLLRFFPFLRRFSYNHVAKEYETDFLPQEIGKAIAHLRPCLEELELSSMCERNGQYDMPTEIGSLAGFESLKNIDVEGDILLGYPDIEDDSRPVLHLPDILPRTLESLRIGPTGFPSCEEHLAELLLVKDEKFPALKKINMVGLGRPLTDPRGLRREFKAKGVRLIL